MRVLGGGLVRIADGSLEKLGQVTVVFTRLSASYQPSQESAEAFAAGMADQVVSSVRGARLKERPTTQLVRLGGQLAARIAFDVDGASGPFRFFQHTIAFNVWAPGGTYTLELSTTGDNARAFDALADDVASTIHLTHQAPPRPAPAAR